MPLELDITQNVFSVFGVFFILIALAVVLAFLVRGYWIVRLLSCMYISLALILVLPKSFFFSELAGFFFFALVALALFFSVPGRLFDAEGEWSDHRIPWKLFFFSFLMLAFLFALWLYLTPKDATLGLVSRDVYDIFTQQPWFFIWIAAPLVYALIVRR